MNALLISQPMPSPMLAEIGRKWREADKLTTPAAKENSTDRASNANITTPPSADTKDAAMPMRAMTSVHIPTKTAKFVVEGEPPMTWVWTRWPERPRMMTLKRT